MKEIRNKHGSTLSLVAVCLIVLVILGVAFYYFSRMFGGGKEVGDGVDGGAIGVARHASKQVGFNLTANGTSDPNDIQQFLPLTDPPVAITNGSTSISVLTYNRLVAQAMLVSLNAASMHTTQASTNAGKVWNSVKYVGQQLTTQLNNASYFANSFNIIANQSNTSMLGIKNNNPITYNSSQFKTGYMRNGLASNIYIPQDLINNFSSTNPADDFSGMGSTVSSLSGMLTTSAGNNNSGSLTFPVGTSAYGITITGAPAAASSGSGPGFLAGYSNVPSTLCPIANFPALVPVVPGNPPHLVSKTEFVTQSASSPVAGALTTVIPPNAYQAGGTANQNVANSTTNSIANSIACSVVGCPTSNISGVNGSNFNTALLTATIPSGATSNIQTLAGQYPMQIPGGYIRLDNIGGLAPPPGDMVTNGALDIFNNQLYGGNGIAQANLDATGNGVFSSSAAGSTIINAWATYNAYVAASPVTTPVIPGTPGTPAVLASAGPPPVAAVAAVPAVPASGGIPINYYPPDANAKFMVSGVSTPASTLYPPILLGSMAGPDNRMPDPSTGFYYLIYATPSTPPGGTPANLNQLKAITSLLASCSVAGGSYPASGPTPSVCGTQVPTWQNCYSSTSSGGFTSGNNYNAVEYLKGYLLVQRGPECGNGLRGVSVSNTPAGSGGALNGTASGMHLTPMNMSSGSGLQQPMSQPTQNNNNSPQYSLPGNPIQLLTAVGNPTGKSLVYTSHASTGFSGTFSYNSQSKGFFDFLNFMEPAYASLPGSGPTTTVSTVSTGSATLTPGTALYNIYQRCREIKPGVTPEEIISAMDTANPLEMGNSMYLYVNPSSGMFACDGLGPKNYYQSFSSAYSDQSTINANIIDGNIPTGSIAAITSPSSASLLASSPSVQSSLASTGNAVLYQADTFLVDTQATQNNSSDTRSGYGYPPPPGISQYLGDANYHYMPFMNSAQLTGMDAAVWIPCSGYHNLLGIVQFQTTVPTGSSPVTVGTSSGPNPPPTVSTGPGGTFSSPN